MKTNYYIIDVFCQDEVARKEIVQKKIIEIIQSKCYDADGIVISLNGGVTIE